MVIYHIWHSVRKTRGLISPHQKCDTKQPCATCVNREAGADCAYGPQPRRPRLATRFQTSVNTSSGPPTGTPSDVLTLSSFRESTSPLFPFLPSREQPSTSTPELPQELSPRIHDGVVVGPSSNVSVVQEIHGAMECVPPLTGFSFTILPSIHFRTIPRPLRVPLPFPPPEYIQVSSIVRNDLDMTLCVCIWLIKFTRSWGLNRSLPVA